MWILCIWSLTRHFLHEDPETCMLIWAFTFLAAEYLDSTNHKPSFWFWVLPIMLFVSRIFFMFTLKLPVYELLYPFLMVLVFFFLMSISFKDLRCFIYLMWAGSVHVHMHSYRHQRAICRNRVSPSIMWALGIEFGSSCLAASTFPHLAHSYTL